MLEPPIPEDCQRWRVPQPIATGPASITLKATGRGHRWVQYTSVMSEYGCLNHWNSSFTEPITVNGAPTSTTSLMLSVPGKYR